MIALAWRDVRRAWTSGGAMWPMIFFLLVCVLFPFAVGPDARLLARVAAGVVWTAALLAALLPVERLIGPDLESGVMDQLSVREIPLTVVATAKMLGHWLGFAPPLMLAVVIAAALLGMSGDALLMLEVGLLLGTPGLAALAVATAALTAGLRGAGAVAGLVMLPFAVPLLIFGAGAGESGATAYKLLGAMSLLLVAGAPFVTAAALRLVRD